MPITLRPMTEQDFPLFQKDSTELYVAQLMEGGSLTREEAEKRAQADNKKFLPEGQHTKGNIFLSIFEGESRIGYFWFGLREKGGVKSAFTYAFEMSEEGKGHGYSAMVQARKHLRDLGVQKVTLHVFSLNERAVKLYQTVGFQVDSYNMSVQL